MDAMPISEFARRAKISKPCLVNYVRPFRAALEYLGHKGYSYNYKEVLFLCSVLVYDVSEFYPDEDKAQITIEQQQIVNEVYEKVQLKQR